MKPIFRAINTHILPALLGGFLLSSCQETTSRETATAAPQATSAAAEPAADGTAEYLDWETATLNGKQPALGKTEGLYKLLGQPDSLVTPNLNDVCGSFYSKKFRYAYFKQSVVEVYGDTAVIGSLDFRHNPQLELRTAAVRLNHTTKLDDLAKLYPAAVKKQSVMNVQGLGQVTAVSLPTGKTPHDDTWLLFFDGGKLIRIDYWMPC